MSLSNRFLVLKRVCRTLATLAGPDPDEHVGSPFFRYDLSAAPSYCLFMTLLSIFRFQSAHCQAIKKLSAAARHTWNWLWASVVRE